ncbi:MULTISPECIES: hypothetical protein [Bradyrhizobium]|jgi:hypothetical protein|uniref:hypothetical protein n=1 Tax=Bradyrhizobium elkanii TaxID=29448 RepID=UPI002714F115|nr:hypothetical protein [Bradyrhizobium elkanii]WLA44959.1 hypothetical protein QIH80_23765 [Bradyrhizobium elkanii]WLB84911.1 hypothetical protein QIH83_21125 [Bradyrhizobium elkanii]
MSDDVTIARTLAAFAATTSPQHLATARQPRSAWYQAMQQISQVSQDVTCGVRTDFEIQICNGAVPRWQM